MNTRALRGGIVRQWKIGMYPNTLTAIRAFAVLPALLLMYLGWHDTLFALVVVASITDAEGFIARYMQAETELGRVFDPLADKFFTNTMFLVYFVTMGDLLMLILLALNLGYDIDNTVRRIKDIEQGCIGEHQLHPSTPVTWTSKVKTFVLYITLIVLFIPLHWGMSNALIDLLMGTSVLLVALSWWKNRKETIYNWRY